MVLRRFRLLRERLELGWLNDTDPLGGFTRHWVVQVREGRSGCPWLMRVILTHSKEISNFGIPSTGLWWAF